MLPALTRHKLSTLVNELLHREENRIPFDILINGEFLRTTVDEFLTKNGINAETTLDVEYTRALVPPLNVTSFEHDDWVSAVDVLSQSSQIGAGIFWNSNFFSNQASARGASQSAFVDLRALSSPGLFVHMLLS